MLRKLLIIFLPLIVAGILGTVYYQKIYKPQNETTPGWEVEEEEGLVLEMPQEPVMEALPEMPEPKTPTQPETVVEAPPAEPPMVAPAGEEAILLAAKQLTTNPLLAQALAQDAALKRFVQFLDAIANGKIPTLSLGFVGEIPLFEAAPNADGYLAETPQTKQRLNPLVQAAIEIPADKAAAWFTMAEPRLQVTLQNLGYQDMTIRQLLTDAITVILQVPIFNFDPELVSTGKTGKYEYKDPIFQELNEFQKAMVRLGYDNCNKIRTASQNIAKELKLFK